jgi:two-component system, OmpR family, sensor histidine kinase MtrB
MMLTFGFGALALCVLIASISYLSVRSSVLGQQVSDAESRAAVNAHLVGELAAAGSNNAQIETVLSDIDGSAGISKECPLDSSVLYMGGLWLQDASYLFVRQGQLTNDVLPSGPGSVQNAVATSPNAAEQIIAISPCGAYVLVGYAIPLPGASQPVWYFALSSTEPVTRLLHVLAVALLLSSLVTIAAAVVLGRWGADRVLRPLRRVAEIASAIADGQMDSRIEAEGSGDLAVLASSFNQMVDRLQSRIEHDARFASDVSHELRSPITTLATALSVIESRREELPERAQQALDLLSAEVRRFQAMVRDLLEMSRLDAGAVDLQMNVVEVSELVENALSASGGTGVPLVIDPALAGRYLEVDKRRIERIMTNLIDNAERHAGGAVRVSVEPPAGEEGAAATAVDIAVEDAGPGVAPEERERIFRRFARGQIAQGRRGRGGGSGLGLALVTEHVRIHQGRIWVEDRAGGGARFVVELPLLSDAELSATLESEPVSEDALHPGTAAEFPA